MENPNECDVMDFPKQNEEPIIYITCEAEGLIQDKHKGDRQTHDRDKDTFKHTHTHTHTQTQTHTPSRLSDAGEEGRQEKWR